MEHYGHGVTSMMVIFLTLYSLRNEFTGFISAARMDLYPTAITAIVNVIKIAKTKIPGPIWIRNAKVSSQLFMTHQAKGAAEAFTLVLAGLKAYLENNIELNLIADRFPKGIE